MSTTAPDRYAVIGHPIAHSRSPWIHARFAAQTGQHLLYTAIDAAPEELAASVRGFFAQGGRGLNVTVPHKLKVMELLDDLSERAASPEPSIPSSASAMGACAATIPTASASCAT